MKITIEPFSDDFDDTLVLAIEWEEGPIIKHFYQIMDNNYLKTWLTKKNLNETIVYAKSNKRPPDAITIEPVGWYR
jgi:hypothetical protein